jgi:hypothetical protein
MKNIKWFGMHNDFIWFPKNAITHYVCGNLCVFRKIWAKPFIQGELVNYDDDATNGCPIDIDDDIDALKKVTLI